MTGDPEGIHILDALDVLRLRSLWLKYGIGLFTRRL